MTVITYNLKYAGSNPPNAWPVRRPLVREVIQQIAPDVFGTQQGLYAQLKDIASDLPDYEWIGLGREGGSRGDVVADSTEIVTFSRDGTARSGDAATV
jgi:hypothetical protein